MKFTQAIFFTLFVLFAGSAQPAAIVGGRTSVALNSSFVGAVTGAGITPAAVAPGTLMGTTATFPITGGDTTTGIIDHSGGLSFTAGTHSAVIENFVIDLNTMLLSGEVIANGGIPAMGVHLFDIGSGDTLTIDSTLATDLSAVFGVPNLTGATVGVATVSPITGSAVPEPSTFGLLAFAAAAMGGIWLLAKPRKLIY
jgi:hypothetical protein